MAENEGAPEGETEAPAGETPDVEAPKTGTQAPDEVTLLRSRAAGLDAKVTELTKASKAADDRAAEAVAKLADYEAGKVGADEALRAQLKLAQDETAAAKKEASLARVEAKYPETFALFGEDAAAFSEDKLAASEARLRGVPEEEDDEPPKPRGNNAPKGAAGSGEPKTETSADILADLKRQPIPDDWR